MTSSVMSFAASTAPGAKQHFLSSKRNGALKKIITPKNRQWISQDELDAKPKKRIDQSNTNEANSTKILKQKDLSNNKDIVTPKLLKSNQKADSSKLGPANEKKHIPRTKHTHEKGKLSDHSQGESTLAHDNDDELGNISGKVVGNNIYITSVKKHKEMLFQRKRYEQRIEQLEADLKEVLQFYENLYKENETLKTKLNMDDQIIAESYKTVLNDRDILRAAEATYKKRITQLEKELKEKNKENNLMGEEIKKLKKENKKLNEDIKQLIGQLCTSDSGHEKEIAQDEYFWEKKPKKGEIQWLMKKILQNSDKAKDTKSKQTT